jgi:single-strand DNA-binding protein
MASDLNVVALTGRLTRDSELRYTNGGMAIAKFSIAVNRRTKKVDQWVDEASFFDCSLFGKSAEGVSQYLSKGQQVAINGSLVQSRWEQDGQNRSRVEVMVNSLTLLGSKSDEQPRQAAPQALESEPSMSNFSDDRIPF